MTRLANIISKYALTSYGDKQYRIRDDTEIVDERETERGIEPFIGGNFSITVTVAANDDSCELDVRAYLEQFAEIDCEYLFTYNE